MSPERVQTEVEGRRLSLSNLDKVMYPASGFTKAALIDYYARIAAVMLPHLRDRPATFRRFPDGVSGKSFVEKHVPSHAPQWVRTVKVPTSGSTGWGRDKPAEGDVEYAVVADRPTLVWAANLAAIEFHVPLWHARRGPLPRRRPGQTPPQGRDIFSPPGHSPDPGHVQPGRDQHRLVASHEDEGPALAGERLRGGASDPAGRSRHNDGFACK